MSKKLKKLWAILNERYGIYTEEQLKKEMKKTIIDIGIFTTPINCK